MDLARYSQFAEQVSPADSLRDGYGEVTSRDEALEAALAAYAAEQQRHLDLPLVHPDRKPLRFDWPGALRHFRVLGGDKELTYEAFRVFDALPWLGMADAACAFLATDRGQAIFADEPYLPDLLDDHVALRRLPKGSLGQDYCDHMESDGLTAAGLVAEFRAAREGCVRLDDKVEWYADRLRDSHDLLHVLTEFDRDVLGEQCVLAFVFHQRPSVGHLFVGYAGAMLTRLHSDWRVPVLRAVFEARQIGKLCPPIIELPIRELLAMPTKAVRARLNLRPARYYREARRIWQTRGIDPKQVLANPITVAA
jgi:ubiquinone biosynthesis protein COQ4